MLRWSAKALVSGAAASSLQNDRLDIKEDTRNGSYSISTALRRRKHVSFPKRSRLRLWESDEGRLCHFCHVVTNCRRSHNPKAGGSDPPNQPFQSVTGFGPRPPTHNQLTKDRIRAMTSRLSCFVEAWLAADPQLQRSLLASAR